MASNSTDLVSMVPWLHFAGGDILFFESWRPSSGGAIAGASIALILLSLLERWVSAMRGILEAHWRNRVLALTASRCSPSGDDKLHQRPRHTRVIAPFIPAHDIPRGAIHAFQMLLGYALMLAVMTFQAAYIISIILGLGIGETLFGRMGGGHSH